MEFNISVWQLIISLLSLIIAVTSMIISILSYNKVNQINTNQIRRDENQYLLTSIISIYNILESDAMLIAQGDFDDKFIKIEIDKQALLEISKAKSYALSTKNMLLFDYLDGYLSGKASEKMGELIDKYFAQRELLIKSAKRTDDDCSSFRDKFLPQIRELRDRTLAKIEAFLSHQ